MMKYYVVDAFADCLFEGNPAGVCIMEQWISDALMQKIAAENNLSETAFSVWERDAYHLRWFTPGGEIDLCGHATLATAYVLSRFYDQDSRIFPFITMSGQLTVERKGDLFELDFPAYHLEPVPVTEEIEQAIGARPMEAWMGRDLVCVMENERQVRDAKPDMQKLMQLEGLLLHMTAEGKEYDCVTRSFAPKLNVAEDPVCGSGHCHVAPLWSRKLGQGSIKAKQASARGGTLYCKIVGDRVKLSGTAVLYAEAQLFV